MEWTWEGFKYNTAKDPLNPAVGLTDDSNSEGHFNFLQCPRVHSLSEVTLFLICPCDSIVINWGGTRALSVVGDHQKEVWEKPPQAYS